MKNIKKPFCTILDIFLLSTIAFVITLWVWYLKPYTPLEVHGDMIVQNVNKTVCTGDFLLYEITYTKHIDERASLDKTLVDGIIFHLAETTAYSSGNVELGESQTLIASVRIPRIVPPGEYFLNIDAVHQVNPIREIKTSFRTDLFKVKDCR